MISQNNDKLKLFLYSCLYYWRYIVVCLFVFLTIAFFYNRYATKIYKSNITVLINDYRKAGFNSEITAFTDKFSLYNQNKVGMENEMEFIKSRENIFEVVSDLNLNINYFSDGTVNSNELYSSSPIILTTKDSITSFIYLTIEIKSKEIVCVKHNDIVIFEGNFGMSFRFENYTFHIDKNTNYSTTNLQKIYVSIMPINYVVESYKSRTITSNLLDDASVIDVSFSDNSIDRSVDYLNYLIKVYERNTIKDKEKQIKKTYDFVLDRLSSVDNELFQTEFSDQNYKEKNNIVDTKIESGITLSTKEEFQKKIDENNVKINLINIEISKLSNDLPEFLSSTILPANFVLQNQIGEYNKDVKKYINIKQGSSINHPEVIKELNNLNNQKRTIVFGLQNFKRQLEGENNSHFQKINNISSKAFSLPKQSNQVARNERKIDIISDNYKYLMNKKEETAISLYSVSPNSKVVEHAYSNGIPIFPSKKIIYFASFLLGLLIPSTIIYLIVYFDNKVKSKHDIVDNTSIPFVGEVVKSTIGVISDNDRSSTSESLRIVRANVDFILKTSENASENVKKQKRIFVTSSIPKEGKTFIAVNLALSFSQTGKKVLLIGLDIRNPKITEYLDIKVKNIGLTNFLVSEETNDKINKYISPINSNFDVLLSGIIPPNPSELLLTEKLEGLFEHLENSYDYIIVDTAPTTLVSDTFLISKYADLFIYVLRQNYSNKGFINEIEKIKIDGRIKNINILLNDVDFGKSYGYYYGYGYNYGYNNEESNKPLFSKILNKIRGKND